MSEQEPVYDFLEESGDLICIRSKDLRYEFKKRSDQRGTYQGKVIYTTDLLQEVLTKERINKVLGCRCKLCDLLTQQTPLGDDKGLATRIVKDIDRQQLLIALVLMGGLFAMRHLDQHTCYTIESTLSEIPKCQSLRSKLFANFQQPHSNYCPHTVRHSDSRQFLDCLVSQFLQRLREAGKKVHVPYFQLNNSLRIFRDKQNLPFIDRHSLPSLSKDRWRQFYGFKIHEDYCDENLKGKRLFCKQVITRSEDLEKEIKRESENLQYLKAARHSNIVEVLFAFSEAHPHSPSFSLVFNFYPVDLQQILHGKEHNIAGFIPPTNRPERFEGSALDHWLWVGVLDIFDAVAVVHQPQNYINDIPKEATARLAGGHFDIKPANVLIDWDGRFLLTDFGQSYIKRFESNEEANFTVGAHTHPYMPPPSYSTPKLHKDNGFEKKMWWKQDYDIWSLACVCVEVLTYINDEVLGVQTLLLEREKEGDESGNFWKIDNIRESHEAYQIKECVKARLSSYQSGENSKDKYLTQVASQVETMFHIRKDIPSSVETCRQALLQAKVDRHLLKCKDDQEIAGEGSHRCLNRMKTSFSTESVSQHCSLYLFTNNFNDRITLALECVGSEGQTIPLLSRTRRTRDEFIPISIFRKDTIAKNNRTCIEHPNFQCAFRNLHDGVFVHFPSRGDYNHFFGAVTHQWVHTEVDFAVHKCEFELFYKSSCKTIESSIVHLQVWKGFNPQDYATFYHSKTLSATKSDDGSSIKSPMPDNRSSRSTSREHQREQTEKQDTTHYCLILYLTTTSEFIILVISLAHNTYNITFSERNHIPRMILERKGYKDKIFAVVYERKFAAGKGQGNLHSHSPINADDFPGVPLHPKVLADHLQRSSGLKKVEIEFKESVNLAKFREFYRKVYGDGSRI